MPKLYSSNYIEKVLIKNNFELISQRGSHIKYSRKINNKKIVVIVPANKKEIPIGTFNSILRQSGLQKEDFS